MRRSLAHGWIPGLILAACADPGPRSSGDEELGGSESSTSQTPGDDEDTTDPLPDLADPTGDGDGDGDGDEDPDLCDPTPSSWDPWIGGPCLDDLDCGYDGGVCLREEQGWPCGTCSQPCDLYCPDIDDAPESFCVDSGYVDPFGIDAGACLQKCDPSLLPSGGCRPG
jgi:hypothetical protein